MLQQCKQGTEDTFSCRNSVGDNIWEKWKKKTNQKWNRVFITQTKHCLTIVIVLILATFITDCTGQSVWCLSISPSFQTSCSSGNRSFPSGQSAWRSWVLGVSARCVVWKKTHSLRLFWLSSSSKSPSCCSCLGCWQHPWCLLLSSCATLWFYGCWPFMVNVLN